MDLTLEVFMLFQPVFNREGLVRGIVIIPMCNEDNNFLSSFLKAWQSGSAKMGNGWCGFSLSDGILSTTVHVAEPRCLNGLAKLFDRAEKDSSFTMSLIGCKLSGFNKPGIAIVTDDFLKEGRSPW